MIKLSVSGTVFVGFGTGAARLENLHEDEAA